HEDEVVELLCNQTKALDIQALPIIDEEVSGDELLGEDNLDKKQKKKVKAEEIARLKSLSLEEIVKMITDSKEVIFSPFSPGVPREPEVNIPNNIDTTDPLALLNLFITPEMYAIIAQNTNLYAIVNNAPTVRTSTNKRYWWPTSANEIRVFYGIFYYMGVHREPNYRIYWE